MVPEKTYGRNYQAVIKKKILKLAEMQSAYDCSARKDLQSPTKWLFGSGNIATSPIIRHSHTKLDE